MLTIFSVETWGQWHVCSIWIEIPVRRQSTAISSVQDPEKGLIPDPACGRSSFHAAVPGRTALACACCYQNPSEVSFLFQKPNGRCFQSFLIEFYSETKCHLKINVPLYVALLSHLFQMMEAWS